jgi:hypothetical protein
MSSASNRLLTRDDLIMLDRVLAHANYPQSPDLLKRDARLEATRFLIESFQKGTTNEFTLRALLSDRSIIEAPIEAMGQKLGEKLFSERFQTKVPPTYPGGGHQLGNRVERNGTWTVHHVFTGVPAQFGKWSMTGLHVKSAIRALKILNPVQ